MQTSSRTRSRLRLTCASARSRWPIEPGSCMPAVDQDDPVAGGQRPGVAVRDAGPRQRQPQPPHAREHPLAPSDFPLAIGLRHRAINPRLRATCPLTAHPHPPGPRAPRSPPGRRRSPTASGSSAAACRKTMNVYLVRDGDGVLLFDAGIRQMAGAVALAARQLGGLTRIVLGHGHADHRGVAPGAERRPGLLPPGRGRRRRGRRRRALLRPVAAGPARQRRARRRCCRSGTAGR